MTRSAWVYVTCVAMPLLGCGGASDEVAGAPNAPLRPGIEDSSRSFKGTLSESENAFWVAVRNGDDKTRESAVSSLKTEVAKDPTNGYSAFIAAAGAFMPPSELLHLLAAGAPITENPPFMFPDDTVPLLKHGLQNLKDPLYVGFDATLLAGIQQFVDPSAVQATWQVAVTNNIPASSIGQLANQLRAKAFPAGLEIMNNLLTFCNGSPLDRSKPDVGAFVKRANAAGLEHRECYSGYFAMHGTEGALLITGDLYAMNGQPDIAAEYYKAIPRAANYSSWPLRSLAERRMSGAQPAAASELLPILTCATCHVNTLP